MQKKLKRLGIEKEITIGYDAYSTTPKEQALETGVCDEVLEIIKEDSESLFDPYHIKYGRRIHVKSKIRVKKYPIIYHLLFGKYKKTNSDFLNSINIYLSDTYGLKDQYNDDLYNLDITIKQIRGEPLHPNYDSYLNQQQKEELILEFLDTITYQQVAKESLEEINYQLDIVSQINAKSKAELIKEMKTRISQAQKNTKNLESINKMLNNKSKKLLRNKKTY